ncbi:MFS transporter [Azospirillum doebereinerae]
MEADRDLDATYSRVAIRLVPFLIAAYVVAYIDRVNIGMAKLQFMSDLGLSEAAFGLGAGLFFAGYMLFEVPSNIVMEKVGARATISRIMLLWGAISAGLAFVSSPMQFYVMRFLLGAAEAGFFPGVILYLSYWIPSSRRGRITSLFTMGGAIAGIIGGPLGGWLMSFFAGTHGLAGWQNLLIYEGLPAIALGLFAWFYLDDRPDGARWLTPRQKRILLADLARDRQAGASHGTLGAALRDPKLYVAFLAWVSVLAGTSTVALWTPTILKTIGLRDVGTIGLMSALPFAFALVAMYGIARRSDRMGERRWHFGLSLMAGATSFMLLGLVSESMALTFVLLTVAASAFWVATPIFWTIPPTYLSGTAAAAGIAFVSSGGALGGLLSPTIIGAVTTQTGSLYLGLATIGAILFAVALLFLATTRAWAPRN